MTEFGASKHIKKIYVRKILLVKKLWQKRALYLLLLYPLSLLILLRYIPMYGVQIAFRNYMPSDTIASSEWVGLMYVKKFMNNYRFSSIMINTLTLGVYDVAVFPSALILAIMVHYLPNLFYQKTVQTISYIPHFITTVVMSSIILQVFSARNGLFNAVMNIFGIPMRNYMGIESAFKHIYTWTSVWQHVGYSSIIYIASLRSVPSELHEAALIDGATLFQRIRNIDIPNLLPTVSVLLILRCGNLLSVGYEKVYLLQNTMNINASEVINTYVYKQGLAGGLPQYSLASAIGLFVSVINLVLLIVVNRAVRTISDNSLW